MKKKVLMILLLFILLLPLPLQAIVKKSEHKYITDDASVLTADSVNYIVKYSDFLYKSKKIDYYVVTVKNLEGKTIEDYSDIIFSYYQVSPKGILVLISKEDRKMRIQVGQEMAKTFNKKMIDKYIKDYFLPYLEREEWNDGIINGYSAIYKFICEEYGIDASSMEVNNLDFVTKYKIPISLVVLWLAGIFSGKIAKFLIKSKYYKDEVTTSEIFIMALIMVINILMLSLSYLLDPVYVILGVVFELFIMYTTYNNAKEVKIKKRRKTEKRRTRIASKKTKIQKRRRKR